MQNLLEICENSHKMQKMCKICHLWQDYAGYSKLCPLSMSLGKNCIMCTIQAALCTKFQPDAQCSMVVVILNGAIERIKTTVYSARYSKDNTFVWQSNMVAITYVPIYIEDSTLQQRERREQIDSDELFARARKQRLKNHEVAAAVAWQLLFSIALAVSAGDYCQQQRTLEQNARLTNGSKRMLVEHLRGRGWSLTLK